MPFYQWIDICCVVGRVNLIDVAGSERIEKTGVDAARFKEAQSINKSLTCLGDVLYALLARQTHVPFRSSKLTHLLQDAFGESPLTVCMYVCLTGRLSV